jgi:hypothetical protein
MASEENVKLTLARLTHDLRPTETTSAQDLLKARKDVALAILDGQYQFTSPSHHTTIGSIASLSHSQGAQYDAAIPSDEAVRAQRVVRRTLGLPLQALRQRDHEAIELADFKPARTHGPFFDLLDRLVFIDVFVPTGGRSFFFSPSSSRNHPTMYLMAPMTPTAGFEQNIGAGTVWLQAQLFMETTEVLDEDMYFGLAIESGTFAVPPLPGNPRSINLKLDTQAASSKAFSVSPVTGVHLFYRFIGGRLKAEITLSGSKTCTILGAPFVLEGTTPLSVSLSHGRIWFNLPAGLQTFEPSNATSSLLAFQGSSPIRASAWCQTLHRLPSLNPELLGASVYQVSSAGAYGFLLKDGNLRFQVGEDFDPFILHDHAVFVDPELLVISGSGGNQPTKPRRINILAPDSSTNRSMGSISIFSSSVGGQQNFEPYLYMANLNQSETWTTSNSVSVSLDQPRTVNDERVPIELQSWGDGPDTKVTWCRELASDRLILNVTGGNVLNMRSPVSCSYALKNLLIHARRPDTADLSSVYSHGSLLQGAVTLSSSIEYTLPFLPDPYATNVELESILGHEHRNFGNLLFAQKWSGSKPLDADIVLLSEQPLPAQTIPRENDRLFADPKDGKTRDLFDLSIIAPEEFGNTALLPDFWVQQLPSNPSAQISSTRLIVSHPPTLLDLSSNSSQFGITFRTAQDLRGRSRVIQAEFSVSKYMLETTEANLRMMCLPATHWEPVLPATAQPPSVFKEDPKLFVYPYSGPSTQIAMQPPPQEFRLVPVAPDIALDHLVERYNDAANLSVLTRLTLPFGMVAIAEMSSEVRLLETAPTMQKVEFSTVTGIDRNSTAEMPMLRPVHHLWYKPGHKLRRLLPPLGPIIVPQPPRRLVASEDPSFDGIARVLTMGVGPPRIGPDGPDRAEIIDPATNAFNAYMGGQGQVKGRVPLNRFDISGFGASIFSDWNRVLGPSDSDQEEVTKVIINVLLGRTSRELIKLQRVTVPFAFTVSKTIEIKRLNSGRVVRVEGDWHAMSEGKYFYKNPDLITHPGVVLGVTSIRNIRDVSPTQTVPGLPNVEMRMIKFDADVMVMDGNKVRSISGLDLDGSVVSDIPSAPAYMTMLSQMSLGGQIDAVIEIGPSGQKTRLTSITVKAAKDPTTNQDIAVVAAHGVPMFTGSGQWSFASTHTRDNHEEPQPVDSSRGVPLVKVGRHDLQNLLTSASPYMFRDPADLLSVAPDVVYNIVHGALSHRVLFASPEIPFAATAKKGFEVAGVMVADSLALAKAKSIFPTLSTCLPIVPVDGLGNEFGVKQLLEVVPDLGYKFEVPKLPLKDLERVLKDESGVKVVAQTIQEATTFLDSAKETAEDHFENIKKLGADVQAATSSIGMTIDTVSNISKMDVTNIHVVTQTVNDVTKEFKNASRVIGTLSSDAQKYAKMLGVELPGGPDAPDLPQVPESVKHVFGSALEQVQKVLSFLEHLKFLPHFKVSMTNEWAMVMSTAMNKKDLIAKIPPPTDVAVAKVIESFDLLISATVGIAEFLFKMHVGTSIKIPTGVGPIVAIGSGKFDVALGSTGGLQVKLDLGFGIGVDFSVGPFHASANYTQSQTILFQQGVFGLGITAVLRAHVDLVIASADLYLEAKLLVVGGQCAREIHDSEHPDNGNEQTTIWAYASVKIAVHVSIFLVCNIGVEEEAHWESNLNGGPCKRENMSHLIE